MFKSLFGAIEPFSVYIYYMPIISPGSAHIPHLFRTTTIRAVL